MNLKWRKFKCLVKADLKLYLKPGHQRRHVKAARLVHYSVQPLVMGVRRNIAVKVEVNNIDRAGDLSPAFFIIILWHI